MSETIELRKISILGKVCNILSILFTIILCLPLPIVFLFLKNTKKYFSILDSFEKYLSGNISVETLKKNNKNIFYRLMFLTIIFSFPIFFLISENNSSDFETRGNFIFASSIFLMLSLCYYLCFEVNNYLKNNLAK
jgi:NADH:ubiquinone oxidoreductase subunit 3 (subunit A)